MGSIPAYPPAQAAGTPDDHYRGGVASSMVSVPAPAPAPAPTQTRAGLVRRVLTPRRVHRLVRAGQFSGLLAVFLLVLWVTPLAGTIDDEFRLNPPPEDAPSALLATGGPGSDGGGRSGGGQYEPAGTAEGPTPEEATGADDAGTDLGETGGAGGDGSVLAGPTSTPTVPSPAPPSSMPSSGTQSSVPSPTTPPSVAPPVPSTTPAASGAADAARVAAMLAAGLGSPEAAFTAGHRGCLADSLAGAYDPAALAAMAAATTPAGLGSTLTALAPHLHDCLPLETAVLASLLEGATPVSVAACLAPQIAARITWDPLLVVELSPTDPVANDTLASAAVAAAAVCPLG